MSDTIDFGGAKRSQPQQSSASPGVNPGSMAELRRNMERQSAAQTRSPTSHGEPRPRVSEAVEPAKQKAKTLAEDQKAAGADKLKQVAQAIDNAAGNLEGELPMTAKTIRASTLAREPGRLKAPATANGGEQFRAAMPRALTGKQWPCFEEEQSPKSAT